MLYLCVRMTKQNLIVKMCIRDSQYAVPIGGLIMEKYLKGKIAPRKKAIEERMLNSNLIIPETPKKEQHLKTAEEKQNEED